MDTLALAMVQVAHMVGATPAETIRAALTVVRAFATTSHLGRAEERVRIAGILRDEACTMERGGPHAV